MKSLIIFLLLTSVSAQAVTVSFLNMKPDQRFMSFAIDRYLTWLHTQFPSSFKRKGLSAALLDRVDHWVVAEHPEFSQFSVGFKMHKDGKLQQTYRIYIHPEHRSHPLLRAKKLPAGFVPWFYEERVGERECFIGQVTTAKSEELTLERLCEGKSDGQEVVAHSLTPWRNPFPVGKVLEIRRMKDGQIEEIHYTTDSAHPRGVPKELYPVLNLHGSEGLLVLDRYSIDREGRMTIYYP